jgi:hypothetical protein
LNESEVLLDAAVVVIVAPGYKISLKSAGHKFGCVLAFCAMNESDIFSKSNASLSKASFGAVRNAVGIRCGAFSGNMKVSFQAARSIG